MAVETLRRSGRNQQLIEGAVEKVAEAVKPLFFTLKPNLIGIDVYKFYASKFGLSINDIWFGTLMQFKEPLHLHTLAFPDSIPLIVFPASDMTIRNIIKTSIFRFHVYRGDEDVQEILLQTLTDLLAFVLKPEVRKAIEEGAVVFRSNAVSEVIENLLEHADTLAERGVHQYVKPVDIFETPRPRGHIVFFGVPTNSELYSTIKIDDPYEKKEYNVNWVRVDCNSRNVATVILGYDHITGIVPKQWIPDKLLEYIEEVISAHSDAIAKLAEEAKATATRYVLAHLAIVSYAKLEI